MVEFQNFTSLNYENFEKVIYILQDKIQNKNDVYKYLSNGLYIDGSLFPDEPEKDKYYGNLIKIFLDEYKYFKQIQLSKNIKVKKFKKRNPRRKLNGILKNISSFNQYLYKNKEIEFIVINIALPIIKDKRVFIGVKNDVDIQILQRSINIHPYTFNLSYY